MVLDSWHGFAFLPEVSKSLTFFPSSPLLPQGAACAEDRSLGAGLALWDAAAPLVAAGSAHAEWLLAVLTSRTDVGPASPEYPE